MRTMCPLPDKTGFAYWTIQHFNITVSKVSLIAVKNLFKKKRNGLKKKHSPNKG
tara:strand:- start:613 stop:774 length:162 start_codon:yes stop_codon:yes gene_type:complete